MNNTLVRPEPIYKQIAAQFQQNIENGELQPGDSIPSTVELAKQFDVAIQTAQNALQEISKRGLVVRIPGRGTFVTNNLHCNTVALLTGKNMFAESETLIHPKLMIESANYLSSKGWNTKIYTPSIQTEEEQVISELESDIRAGKIKFIIAALMPPRTWEWINKECTIPWIRTMEPMGSQKRPYEDMLNLGLPFLEKCGYRQIGLLFPKHIATLEDDVNDIVKEYVKKNSSPLKTTNYQAGSIDSEHGMQTIMDEITPKNAPDALFVLDDNLCRGAILALLSKGLTFPDKIGLLTHANEGLSILSPVTLTRIEYSSIQLLHGNIDWIMANINGKTLPMPTPSISLKKGLSCKQIKK